MLTALYRNLIVQLLKVSKNVLAFSAIYKALKLLSNSPNQLSFFFWIFTEPKKINWNFNYNIILLNRLHSATHNHLILKDCNERRRSIHRLPTSCKESFTSKRNKDTRKIVQSIPYHYTELNNTKTSACIRILKYKIFKETSLSSAYIR